MMNEYYEKSLTDQYLLTRDGEEVKRGTEIEIIEYIHSYHCYSVSHALKYEGYKIEPCRNP